MITRFLEFAIRCIEFIFNSFGYDIWIEKSAYNSHVEEFFICKKEANDLILYIGSVMILVNAKL